ncbi:MAG: MBL fold metallo-hydrolase [Treponema sp.]|nr:MBL fold metallo-hydrolase [Treponema sp.]
MKFTFLGTGTSHGVPVIACDCEVCRSNDSRDKRLRTSGFLQTDDEHYILFDAGPEFRIQALENNITKLDSILLTHSHADHLHGIDDVRVFSTKMYKVPTDPRSLEQYNAPPLQLFTNAVTAQDLRERFGYIFSNVIEGGGVAKINLVEVKEPFYIGETKITPVPMMHGHLETCGFLVTSKNNKSLAYLTDCNFISDESFALINKNCGTLEHLVIDGLRIKEHSTHFNFDQALAAAEKLSPKHVWVVHLTHNATHVQVTDYLNENLKNYPGLKNAESVLPAYDKLSLEF